MGYMEDYKNWIKWFEDDKEMVAELQAIQGDEKEIEDRFYTELSFGTGGMRGVIGAGKNRINIYNIRRASKGLALYVKSLGMAEKGVVVSYDSRKFSDVFAKQTALVLANNGVKAFLFDALRPVPILSFAVRHLQTAAGVEITASHNPSKYNGYKVYGDDGGQVTPEAADEITKHIRSLSLLDCMPMDEEMAKANGLLTIVGDKEVDDAYIEMVKALSLRPELFAKEGKNLKIVYSPLHGSGNVPVRRTLKELGVENVTIVKEQELPDPAFSTVSAPNPEDPAAYALAIPLAKEVGASVVFATDPDCDRMGVAVLDDKGEFYTLTGNQIGCLLLSHILSTLKEKGSLPKNGAVVKSIVSTQMADAICKDYGITIFNVLTGFKYIGEKMEEFEQTGEYQYLFGFEESFGYLSGNKIRDKDGVNASLLLCEAVLAATSEGKTLYEKLQELYKKHGYYVEKGVAVTLPGLDGVEKMRSIMASLRQTPPTTLAGLKVEAVSDYLQGTRNANGNVTPLNTVSSDVLYYELEQGNWICIRPSGTEPKIKLYINTRHENQAKSQELNLLLQKESMELLK